MDLTSKTHFLDGGGQMAEATRAFDWSSTSLGPIESWMPSLKIAVGMMLNSRFPKCIVWGPDRTTLYNDAFLPILGQKPEALGHPFNEVWAEAWDVIGPIVAKAYAGEATFVNDFPLIVERQGYPEQAYFTFCYSPIRDQDGRVRGMMDTVIETTGKVEAARNLKLLNAELSHRIKNTLAMVTAIVNQTFRGAETSDIAQGKIIQRIAALGQAHSILTQKNWSAAPIQTVVEGALAPHRTGHESFVVEGPPALLSARQALSLALALHELATNAAKYGALSVEGGRVRVTWEADASADGQFRFIWREVGGPAVRPPECTGFGSKIIEYVLASDFEGAVNMIYAREGLRCELVTAMTNLNQADELPDSVAWPPL